MTRSKPVTQAAGARSKPASFASYQDPDNATQVVLAGAGSARLKRRADTDSAVDDVARRDEAAARDATDAERWLDEGGSFSRKAHLPL